MFRFVSLLMLLVVAGVAQGQKTALAAGSDWSKVQAVTPGTEIRIGTKHLAFDAGLPWPRRISCTFIAATDAEIVCTRTDKIFFFPVHRRYNIPREDVASLRLTREDASAVVAGLIGASAGAGAAGGLIAANGDADHSEDPLVYLLLSFLGGLVGVVVGKATDFLGGPTIYRAP